MVTAVQTQTVASAPSNGTSSSHAKTADVDASVKPTYNADGGVTSQLCSWIDGLTLEDIPEAVRTRAKYLFLDGLACALVGARVPWSQKAFDAMRNFEAPGKHVVIGYEERLGAVAAATLNGSWIQACEVDDYHSVAPLHSQAVVIPPLFAAAVSAKDHATAPRVVDGSALLLASVVGFEVGPRVGMALHGTEMLAKGWHCGSIFGGPAAAGSSAKLLGLSAGQIEDAIGVACTQACGLMAAQYDGMVKRMHHGFAARNGLLGTMLAWGGYEGIKKVFERPYGGFLAMYGLGSKNTPSSKPEEVSKDLGEFWHTAEWIRLKLHACCGGIHGTIECLAEMQQKYPDQLKGEAQLAKIKDIHIQLSDAVFHHCGWAPETRPLTATGAQMNTAFVAASQLVDGQVLLDQFASGKLDRDEIWSLVDKTHCSHTAELDQPNIGCGAFITITLEDGSQLYNSLLKPKGVDEPITNEEILLKFRRLTGSLIDAERQAKIEKAVLDMEELTDVEDLINLLSVEVVNPLR
ncbi:cis-aconitic acid decarboxylase [Aspergillus ellipticus CBS 707.79]|uniref:Cis-aconitic acid decarboxylase n=1 Tax=Aspergillus ellipticus CBS 707.79 TaxID=1448320 RepID=A0A319DGC0_9EURO|nr:cis-aconitic acid decarboxylase [Aspergillus ellipticus CBS 707.79]